jgi:hypothetical protein
MKVYLYTCNYHDPTVVTHGDIALAGTRNQMSFGQDCPEALRILSAQSKHVYQTRSLPPRKVMVFLNKIFPELFGLLLFLGHVHVPEGSLNLYNSSRFQVSLVQGPSLKQAAIQAPRWTTCSLLRSSRFCSQGKPMSATPNQLH